MAIELYYGANPITTTVLASPTPTRSVFTVDSAVDFLAGQYILVQIGSDFERVKIASITGAQITLAAPLSTAPATSAAVKSGRELLGNTKLNNGAIFRADTLAEVLALDDAAAPDFVRYQVPSVGVLQLNKASTATIDTESVYATDSGTGRWILELSFASRSKFSKITTGTTTLLRSFTTTKIVKAIVDCTSVSAGTIQLIVDGVTKETLAAGSKTYRVLEAASSVSITTLNTGININLATTVGNVSISAQSSTPKGVHVTDDGAWMYVLDGGGASVFRYSLPTPFTATSRVYGATASDTFNATARIANANGMAMSPDKTKLFLLGATAIYQFTLNTPGVLGTEGSGAITYDGSFSLVASGSSNSSGLAFSYDGTKMYITDTTDFLIRQFDLGTAWRPLTASYASKSFAVTQCEGLMVRADGLKFYIISNGSNNVHQYSMVGGEVTTASDDSLSIASGDTVPLGGYMRRDSLGFYVVGSNSDRVYQFSSGSAFAGTVFSTLETAA